MWKLKLGGKIAPYVGGGGSSSGSEGGGGGEGGAQRGGGRRRSTRGMGGLTDSTDIEIMFMFSRVSGNGSNLVVSLSLRP